MTTNALDEDSPRARLHRLGMDALNDVEVLSLALDGTGDDIVSVSVAHDLLNKHRGCRGLLRAGIGRIANDLSEDWATRLVAAIELGRRALAVPLPRSAPYGSSRDVARAFGPRLIDAAEESVVVVVLDARQRPIAERIIAHGTATRCNVGLREVFTLALCEAGAGVILVHNHPSGDPTPSPEDLALTRAMADGGRLLEVPLVDHVIVGREGTFSFLDAGLLREPRAA